MCLDTVDKEKPKKGKRIAYKIFFRWTEGLVGPSRYTRFRTKVWNKDSSNRDLTASYPLGIMYKTGYHCVTTRDEARRYNKCAYRGLVYKVEVDDVVATGMQDNFRCLVARKLRILERVR